METKDLEEQQRELWDQLIQAWNDDRILFRLHWAKKYTASFPDNMYGWIALADALTQIAHYDQAWSALRKALELCPEGSEYRVYEQIGHMYKEKCDLKHAEQWYRKAVEAHPRQENHVFLGACLAKQGRFDEAKDYHSQAAELSPETADEAYYNLGLINRAEGEYEEAANYFDKAIAIDPEYEDATYAQKELLEYIEFLRS